jgi:hypothetical protein
VDNPRANGSASERGQHLSGAIPGIGAAWFEAEHLAFGLPFGSGFRSDSAGWERLCRSYAAFCATAERALRAVARQASPKRPTDPAGSADPRRGRR